MEFVEDRQRTKSTALFLAQVIRLPVISAVLNLNLFLSSSFGEA